MEKHIHQMKQVTGTNRWDDCALIIELINVGGGGLDDYLKKHPEKKKNLLNFYVKLRA
jgi:hypothetical protein